MTEFERRIRRVVNPSSTALTGWWCHSALRGALLRIEERIHPDVASSPGSGYQPAGPEPIAGPTVAPAWPTPDRSPAA